MYDVGLHIFICKELYNHLLQDYWISSLLVSNMFRVRGVRKKHSHNSAWALGRWEGLEEQGQSLCQGLLRWMVKVPFRPFIPLSDRTDESRWKSGFTQVHPLKFFSLKFISDELPMNTDENLSKSFPPHPLLIIIGSSMVVHWRKKSEMLPDERPMNLHNVQPSSTVYYTAKISTLHCTT